jgi:hypothetical protein
LNANSEIIDRPQVCGALEVFCCKVTRYIIVAPGPLHAAPVYDTLLVGTKIHQDQENRGDDRNERNKAGPAKTNVRKQCCVGGKQQRTYGKQYLAFIINDRPSLLFVLLRPACFLHGNVCITYRGKVWKWLGAVVFHSAINHFIKGMPLI